MKAIERQGDDFDAAQVTDLKDAIYRVLKNPTVASKSFLITIGDRSITGMVARDQMVGPMAGACCRCSSDHHQLTRLYR